MCLGWLAILTVLRPHDRNDFQKSMGEEHADLETATASAHQEKEVVGSFLSAVLDRKEESTSSRSLSSTLLFSPESPRLSLQRVSILRVESAVKEGNLKLSEKPQEATRFELAKYRFDKENKSSGRSRDHSVQRTVDSSPTELSYESIESESRFYELEQKWKHENWSEKAESSESWEEEVDNLLAWTNALDVKSLNYDD
ncbi:hypothetical protein ACRRTK_016956 [Alexandromys fortis]